MAGILDGQSLSAFVTGLVYDVDAHLGIQLIALGGAIEEVSKAPTMGEDASDTVDERPVMSGGVHVITRERRRTPRPGLPCPVCQGRNTAKTVDSVAIETYVCRDCDHPFTVTKV
jgi:hypothetical protein